MIYSLPLVLLAPPVFIYERVVSFTDLWGSIFTNCC